MTLHIITDATGLRLRVKVVPGSSRDRIVGLLGDALKIAVSKPPQGGEANRAVVEILARQLQIPATQIQIVQGHSSPRKQVLISGLTAEQLLAKLGLE